MMRGWLLAIRPKTLIAAISPVCIGTVMAAKSGFFHPLLFFSTLFTGLGIQILTNFVNDLYDYKKGADTIERKGPVRALQQGLMTVAQTKRAIALLVFFTALCAIPLLLQGGALLAILMIFAFLFAFAYTAGPFPLSYLGIAEIFVLIFFGPVATGMTTYLQTKQFIFPSFIAGISPGLISCSLLVINNLRDVNEDRKANKKTLIVRFGTNFGRWEYALTLLLALFPPLFLTPTHPYLLLTLVCLLPILSLIKTPSFEKTGKLLALFTILFCIGWIL